ncbi:hypothetical protein BDW68DRAFT_182772 [Aspergillus falconensis]
MRGLEESSSTITRLGSDAKSRVHRAWDGFVDFAARDNVLEVALGLIIAQAFTSVVNSFVSDVVLPVISLLPFINRNMDEKFAVLSKGPNYREMNGYNTLEQARDDGALVLAYGSVRPAKSSHPIYSPEHGASRYIFEKSWLIGGVISVFLEKVVNFLGISLTLYTLAQIYMVVSQDKIIKRSVRCRYCRKWISEKALRCVNCSSWQDGREDVSAGSS